MMVRRQLLATAIACAALGIAIGFSVSEIVCGESTVVAPCHSAAECRARATCGPVLDPLAFPLVAAAIGGVAAAWSCRPGILMALGVVGAGMSVLFIDEGAYWGVATSALLVIAGWALPGAGRYHLTRRIGAGVAVAASAALVPLSFLSSRLWLAFPFPLLPPALWLVFAWWSREKERSLPAPPA